MATSLLPLFDAFGGLMTEGEATTRPTGTASTSTNMRIGLGGKTLRKAHGSSRWSAGRAVAEPILGLIQFIDKQGVLHEICRAPSGYYERNLGTGLWTTQLKATNREDDGIPMFASTQGRLFVVDGYSAYVYDGTTWSTWARLTPPRNGIVNQTDQRPSLQLAGGGSLTAEAEYEVFFTFADSGTTYESAPSEIMRIRTTSAAGGKAIQINTGYAGQSGGTPNIANDLFHVPSDVAAVTTPAIHAYISAADTPGAWYRASATTIPNQASEVTITITANATTNQFTDFYGPPSYATGLTLHHSRLWTWGSPGEPTRIWFTGLEGAGTFNADAFLDIGVDQPNDPIRACIPYGEGGGAVLLILKLNSVWQLTGNDFATFVAQLVKFGPSCQSDHAAVRGTGGSVYWAGYEGIYRYSGGEVLNISDGKLKDTWRSANKLISVA